MGKSSLWVALLLVACSGSAGGNGPLDDGAAGEAKPNGGASEAGASAGSVAGGRGGAGGSSNAAGGSSNAAGASDAFTATLVSAPVQTRGVLSIAQYSADLTSFETNVDIYFSYVREQWDGCTRYQLGSCGYYDCPEGSNPIGSNAGLPPIYYDGGTATITGLPPAIVAPFSQVDGQLFARPAQQLWPSAGGSIRISVAGGSNVPAFDMQLQAPPMVRLLNINGQAAPTTFKRGDGMKLSWSSEGPGNVAFYVYALSGARPAAVCQFDAAAGQGELPAAVLAHLDAGPSYFLAFRGQAKADLQVEGWTMSALVGTHGFALEDSTTPKVTLE